MKKFLLAATALTLSATAAWAIDDDHHQTRIAAAHGTRVIIADDGPVIEVRGADGERTIHVERDGEDSTINVNGQEIIVRDGTVYVDGQAIESEGHSVIIVEGDEVRVIDGEDASAFGSAYAMHMGERAEHMVRMHEEMGNMRGMVVDIDVEGIETEVMVALESALAGLEVGAHFDGEDWDDLSEEEQAEVRAELEEAREEIRRAMHEVRNELRASGHEMRDEQRRMRVEMRHAGRDAAHAEREMAHAERDAARAARDAARSVREHHRMRWQDAGDEHHEQREIRIEEDEDGNRRVWVNGEEVDGDDVMIMGENRETIMRDVRVMDDGEGNRRVWVNGEEVEGGHARVMQMHGEHGGMERREVRVEVDEDGNRQVWVNGELAESGDVMFMERSGHTMRWTDNGEGPHVEHAMNDNVRVEDGADGRRRIWVDGEEQTGDDLIEWLNRLESQRLAGGPADGGDHQLHRRVMRFEAEDGAIHEMEMGGERRVVVIHTTEEHGELHIEVEED
jgi:archaellum component FlaG (FlaF/FlaG flagellin family)